MERTFIAHQTGSHIILGNLAYTNYSIDEADVLVQCLSVTETSKGTQQLSFRAELHRIRTEFVAASRLHAKTSNQFTNVAECFKQLISDIRMPDILSDTIYQQLVDMPSPQDDVDQSEVHLTWAW